MLSSININLLKISSMTPQSFLFIPYIHTVFPGHAQLRIESALCQGSYFKQKQQNKKRTFI